MHVKKKNISSLRLFSKDGYMAYEKKVMPKRSCAHELSTGAFSPHHHRDRPKQEKKKTSKDTCTGKHTTAGVWVCDVVH
jgi:hypothetical protein